MKTKTGKHRVTLRTILRRRVGSVVLPDGGRLTKAKLTRLSDEGWFTKEVRDGQLAFIRTDKPWVDAPKQAHAYHANRDAYGSYR